MDLDPNTSSDPNTEETSMQPDEDPSTVKRDTYDSRDESVIEEMEDVVDSDTKKSKDVHDVEIYDKTASLYTAM